MHGKKNQTNNMIIIIIITVVIHVPYLACAVHGAECTRSTGCTVQCIQAVQALGIQTVQSSTYRLLPSHTFHKP